jgi:hypothetical protein
MIITIIIIIIIIIIITLWSSDSVVGMTRYGLDGPGIESLLRRDFPHLSRLALGLTRVFSSGNAVGARR